MGRAAPAEWDAGHSERVSPHIRAQGRGGAGGGGEDPGGFDWVHDREPRCEVMSIEFNRLTACIRVKGPFGAKYSLSANYIEILL